MAEKIKIIAIVGPTATGKTALSVELAKRFNGEIISCDSMQIYKNMDIGTAKVKDEETCGIKHHLVGIAEPIENFSCADYAVLAKKKAEEILARGKIPIFCGGTGLYLDSVLSENEFSAAGQDTEYREKLMKKSPDELYAELLKIDPQSAEKTHKNNVKRVIRALEIRYITGITKTEWDRRSREKESRYDAFIIGLDYKNRETLYGRINKRVDMMIEEGLINEVKALDCKSFRESTASQGIGYKEILAYIDGKATLSDTVEQIKKNSRNYAKRQITWFRKNKKITWIYRDDPETFGMSRGEIYKDDIEYIADYAEKIIRNRIKSEQL